MRVSFSDDQDMNKVLGISTDKISDIVKQECVTGKNHLQIIEAIFNHEELTLEARVAAIYAFGRYMSKRDEATELLKILRGFGL